jgi:hypothetical protein
LKYPDSNIEKIKSWEIQLNSKISPSGELIILKLREQLSLDVAPKKSE